MIPRLLLLVIVSGFGFSLGAAESAGSAILPTAKRAEALEQAHALLQPKPNPIAALPADFIDPFNPPDPDIALAAAAMNGNIPAKPARVNDHDILILLAAAVRPSGVIYRNDNPILLMHEKKLRVGDSLTLKHEDTDYTVTISAIEKNTFTLRLNSEEIIRPIKSGSAP